MNTNELFALIDDWTGALDEMNQYTDSDQFELGRESQMQSCIDQLLAVIAVSGLVD